MPEPHLSALKLDRGGHPDARRESRDLHRMHTRVLAALDGIPLPDGGRVLWGQPKPDLVLIQSGGRITPACLPRGYGAVTSSPVNLTWTTGQHVSWSLLANPSRCPPSRTDPDGTRHQAGLRRPVPLEERDDWLHRKLDGALDIAAMCSQPLGTRSGIQTTTGRRITHTAHAWSGDATVTDPDTLTMLQLGGIGPGKGYGFGLLLVLVAPTEVAP